ncbi:sugar phosphotransferase, partial [Streptomyces sp. SID8455]|nr:sugar phosphotransferase [Streptomyces sp. SID8455]
MIHPINATVERAQRALPPGLHEVPVGMHRRLAHVQPGLTPLAVRAQHLSLVSTALTQAGVEHFVVPGTEDTSSAIGVRDEQRGRVAQALRSLFSRSPGYIQRKVPVLRTGEPLQLGSREASWQGLETVDVLRAVWFQADPSGHLVYGTEYGCDIEFWREEDGRLLPPRINRGASYLPVHGEMTLVSPHRFSRLAPPQTDAPQNQRRWGRKPQRSGLPTRQEFVCTGADEITFPIDVVYTWVDSDDPAWQRRRAEASGDVFHEESASAGRYINRDELLYSMRSLHMYAPWVRHIFLVTDDQVPHWLNSEGEGITVVSHREIFRETSRLPVFNSHAISAQLHRVPGLSEHFIHFNDDVFVGRPITPHEFFLPNGASKHYPDTVRIPMGPILPEDLPHEVARKNVRALLEGRFGRTIID